MLTSVDYLLGWASGWISSGRTTPLVSVHLGDATFDPRAAFVQIEGLAVAGQLTVWVTGACQLEAYRIETGEVVILEHRQIDSLEELEGAVHTVLAACESVQS